MNIVIGKETHFEGDFSLKGLPDIDETFMSVTIKELTTSKRDIETFRLPPYDKVEYIKLSSNMAMLGKVKIQREDNGILL